MAASIHFLWTFYLQLLTFGNMGSILTHLLIYSGHLLMNDPSQHLCLACEQTSWNQRLSRHSYPSVEIAYRQLICLQELRSSQFLGLGKWFFPPRSTWISWHIIPDSLVPGSKMHILPMQDDFYSRTMQRERREMGSLW